jgi:bacteriorhodopsin
MNGMFKRDCLFACVFVTVLWLTYGFVYFMITPLDVVTGAMQTALTVGGLAVCVFNTAGVIFLIRNNSQNKELIYTIDLRHLDAVRAAKKAGK